ncbi:MAG: MarR family transcriptional regulator [Porticoccaceae bacterium]|nr:MarR family transcriptional regulator [Porticoccaceae bacterium]|tara:strand:- start:6 stop:458 length:453 start_codon:yes stop_codon:yes gene_type:complete
MPAESRLQQTYQFFNEINIIAQLTSNEMARTLPHGLTVSQFSVLNWFLRVDDEATPGRLARAFQVSKGAMTNTLKRLDEKRFVTVMPDPASGRRKLVRITPAGRAARDESIAAMFPVLAEFTGTFDPGEVAAMLPRLAEIRQWLDERRSR